MNVRAKLTVLATAALAIGIGWTACTSETEQGGGEKPIPGDNNGERREVLLNLNNKLALRPVGSKGASDTQPDTKAIATPDENAIATLDVYIFGSDREDGTYTYQERFAYRADGTGNLPEGATALSLATSGTDGSVTTALLSLRKGLFVKLYCIANQPAPTNPADKDTPVPDTYYTPLVLTAGTPGNSAEKLSVLTPGIPDEATFRTFHTPFLAAATPGDTLTSPLPMTGALTLPLDLTDFGSASRIQTSFRLTRLVARFDVTNDATQSRFLLREISMDKGRKAARFFPIKPYGDLPQAAAGDLISYPARTFAAAGANAGLSTGAFYCYPSPAADGGALVLRGLYRVNASEEKEVSYRIPFRREGTDTGSSLEINENHRYTIAITKADEYHLDATLTVADWADDGRIDDFEPDVPAGEYIVTIPPIYEADTYFEKEKHTVTMSLAPKSTFDVVTGSNSGLLFAKGYVGNSMDYDWLDVEVHNLLPALVKSTTQNYTYTVRLKEGYDKGRYPRAILRFTDIATGDESVFFVDALPHPRIIDTKQEESSLSTLDLMLATPRATLYRLSEQRAKVDLRCSAPVELVNKPDWLDVTSNTLADKTHFTFSLNDLEVKTDYPDDIVPLYFRNREMPDCCDTLSLALVWGSITADFTQLGGTGNSYASGNIRMQAAPGNTASVSCQSGKGVHLLIEYPEGTPGWLTSTGNMPPYTKAQVSNNVTFSLVDANLPGAKTAKVTLKNDASELHYSFTITPVVEDVVTAAVPNSASPEQNTYDGDATVMLYQVDNSSVQIKATSVGGTTILGSPTGVKVTGGNSSATDNTYTVTLDPATSTGGSFVIANRTDNSKQKTITVTGKTTIVTEPAANIDLSVAPGSQKSTTFNTLAGCNATVNWNGGTADWFALNATSFGGNSQTITATTKNLTTANLKKATVTLTNKLSGGKAMAFTITPTMAIPTATLVTGATTVPSQNKFDNNATMTLYRVAGSKLNITANAIGGTKIANARGVTVARIAGNDNTTSATYTVTLVNASTVDGAFDLVNSSDASGILKRTINITAPATTNSVVPGNQTLSVVANATLTPAFNTPEGFRAAVAWGGGSAWFTIGTDFGANNQSIALKSTAPDANIQTATVTLTNKITGGTGGSFTVTPIFAQPTMAYANNNSPVQNSMTGSGTTGTASLYNVANSKLNVTVASVGGVMVFSNTGVGVSANTSDNTSNTYTLTWNGSAAPGNYSVVFANKRNTNLKTTLNVTILSNAITASNTDVNAANSGTNNISVTSPAGCTASILNNNWNGGGQWFDITTNPGAGTQNLVITQKSSNVNTVMKPVTVRLTSAMVGGTGVSKDITITPTNFQKPTLSATSGSAAVNQLNKNSLSSSFTMTAPAGSLGNPYSSNTNIATISVSGTTVYITPVSTGTTTIIVPNASSTEKSASYSITVKPAKTYDGANVWYYYGYYIAATDAGTSTWNATLSTTYCANKAPNGTWKVPSDAEWRVIIGGTSGENWAPDALYQEMKDKKVFATATSYWSSTAYGSDPAYYLTFNIFVASVSILYQSSYCQVRCVSDK